MQRRAQLLREHLLEGLSQGELSIDADAAPLVFQAADAGDAVAAACIAWIGRGSAAWRSA